MKTTNEIPASGILIHNIIIQPVQRAQQDILKWRSAMQSAEGIMQNRIQLYDLYEDLLLDGVLSSVVEKRILNVTKHNLLFIDGNGIENREITQLAAFGSFIELRKEILLSKFYGISVIELMKNEKGFRIYSTNRKHIKPKQGKITYEQNGDDGLYYREAPYNKFVFEVGEWQDLGLLLMAAPYVIYKRGGFGNWANFTQLFGMPFREARYDGFNDATRRQLETALDSMGSAAYGIFPKDSEIKFHEAGNAEANGKLYDLLRSACNEEIAIGILGQTNTTLPSAATLGGESKTHQQTQDNIAHADCEEELSILNTSVVPILKNLGYNVNGKFSYKNKTTRMPVLQHAQLIANLKNKVGLPISDDYVYETLGFPKPKNYDELKAKI